MSASDNLQLARLYERSTEAEQAKVRKILGIDDIPSKKSLKHVPVEKVLAAIEMLEKYKGPDQTTSTTRMTLEQEASMRWQQHFDTLTDTNLEHLVLLARDLTSVKNIGTGDGQIHWQEKYGRMTLYIYLLKLAKFDPLNYYSPLVGTVTKIDKEEWEILSQKIKATIKKHEDAKLVKAKVDEWKAAYNVTDDEMLLLGKLFLTKQEGGYMAFTTALLALPRDQFNRMEWLITTLAFAEWK